MKKDKDAIRALEALDSFRKSAQSDYEIKEGPDMIDGAYHGKAADPSFQIGVHL